MRTSAFLLLDILPPFVVVVLSLVLHLILSLSLPVLRVHVLHPTLRQFVASSEQQRLALSAQLESATQSSSQLQAQLLEAQNDSASCHLALTQNEAQLTHLREALSQLDSERDEACNQADLASEKAARAEQATRACTTKLEDVTRAAKKARDEAKDEIPKIIATLICFVSYFHSNDSVFLHFVMLCDFVLLCVGLSVRGGARSEGPRIGFCATRMPGQPSS